MKKVLPFILFFYLFFITSCSTPNFGYFYVNNKTNEEIKDFEIFWDADGETKSRKFNTIPAKSRTEEYGAFLIFEESDNFKKRSKVRSNFSVKYFKDGVLFTVENSKTKEYDSAGKCFDEQAYMKIDESVCIDIYFDGYLINHSEK